MWVGIVPIAMSPDIFKPGLRDMDCMKFAYTYA